MSDSSGPWIWQSFLRHDTKSIGNIKQINRYIGVSQNKKLCPSKDIIKRVRKQLREWEETFPNHTPDMGLIPRIYEELLKLNKKSKPIFKCAKDLIRHSSKDNMQMANEHIKICSTPLVIKYIQTKTTMRYHFIPTRITKILKMENNMQG